MRRTRPANGVHLRGVQEEMRGVGEAWGRHETLADLKLNESGKVVSLAGGRFVVQRLAAFGITPGAEVQVNQNPGWGPLIVSARGARVALGRGEAHLIGVERTRP